MKRFKLAISDNPSFNTVLNLTNTTFDPNNIVEGRMATEDQVQQLSQDIADLEQRNDYCCRDIVVWRSYVRVVAENTGIVISDWLDNYATGTSRRGRPFTVEFALPHDETKFYMNKSSTVSSLYSSKFLIHLNKSGYASEADTILKTRIGQPFDNTSPRFDDSNYLTTSTTSNVKLTGALPSAGDRGSSATQGYFYVYKDTTDNKIKMNVRISNQFAQNEYFCIALIQFVLKAGQTM